MDTINQPDALQESIQLPYGNGQTWQQTERQHREEVAREVATAISTLRRGIWTTADIPPDGTKGKWSRQVVVVTCAGDCFRLAYFHDDRSTAGYWQRPKAMQPGDIPLYWTDIPNNPTHTMPNTTPALQCAHCGKLHFVDSRYITITATIMEHQMEKDGVQTEPESVQVKDVVVCDNVCLGNLLALKGF